MHKAIPMTLLLSGCTGSAAAPPPADLPRPDAHYMTKVAPLVSMPAAVEMNKAGEEYSLRLRNQCADRGEKLVGLQRYVETVISKEPKK